MLCTDRFHCVYTEEVSNSVTQSLCKSLFLFWSWSVSGSWKTSCHLRIKYKSLCESVNALHNQHVTNIDHVENSIVSLNPTCSSGDIKIKINSFFRNHFKLRNMYTYFFYCDWHLLEKNKRDWRSCMNKIKYHRVLISTSTNSFLFCKGIQDDAWHERGRASQVGGYPSILHSGGPVR